MRHLATLLTFILPLMLLAQAPQAFDFQGIARTADGQVIATQAITLRLSIRSGAPSGSVSYQETHAITTNAFGLFMLQVGQGTPIAGDFTTIGWGGGAHFLQGELDAAGGGNFTDMGTQQLRSVPYAMHALNGIPGGGSSGQLLTNCNGVATWTTDGQCPGDISGLACNNAVHTGALYAGFPAGTVSSTVPYTGGNGGPYEAQSFSSTGVTGLTATLASGNFAPYCTGSGTLVFTISGTPSGVGTASFALTVGGQSCTIERTVTAGIQGATASCGASNVHNPDLVYGQMTDQQGNTYRTIVIGSQEWMAENLQTSNYRNGDAIAYRPNDGDWQYGTGGAFSYPQNNGANQCPYGKLYNWYAVSDPRNVCPTGWHVPSDGEWQTLETALGMPASELNNTGGRGLSQNVGGKLKAVSPLWLSPNTGATDSSGFTGLPGGYRYNGGSYFTITNSGYWWTTTQFSSTAAMSRSLNFNSAVATRVSQGKAYGLSVRCVKDSKPAVTTSSVSVVDHTSATCGGMVSDDGGYSVTAHGVCWSTSPGPTVALPTKTIDGNGVGSFTSSITGLAPGPTYYVRAYATNAVGTGYGNEITFTTLGAGQFTDINGNVYDTIAIGTQVWMKQNLKVANYRNGDSIPTNLSNTTWQNTTSGAYAIYNNTAANDSIYGKLYNWYAVADPRGLCPTGWHLPSDAEWQTLEIALGLPAYEANSTGNRGSSQNVGGKIKAVSPLWSSPNTGANNSSGFTGLPGGYRYYIGPYDVIGNGGGWWSSTQYSPTDAWYRLVYNNYGSVLRYNSNKRDGSSVRCVRD